MNIYEKLLAIQTELKCNKSQYNSFGKYNYRSLEDIMEAVKPLCAKHKAVLFIQDSIEFVEGRHYVKATATLVNTEKPEEKIEVSASARESEIKKGMDDSQVTGATSSYARKYTLNGLFDIDDTKDADTDEFKKQEAKPEPKIDIKTIDFITSLVSQYAILKNGNADELLKYYLNKFKVKNIEDLTYTAGVIITKELSSLINRRKQQ
jgi:hypothetical protein